MRARHWMLTAAIAAAIVAGWSATPRAQPYRQQGISPIFDGWEELPDGYAPLLFRLYQPEQQRGDDSRRRGQRVRHRSPADRGQPTSFLPGRHSMCSPSRQGPKAKLTWTVKTDAGVQTANASFDLLYILEERENEDPNAKPPAVTSSPMIAKVGEPVRLAPQVTPATGGHAADGRRHGRGCRGTERLLEQVPGTRGGDLRRCARSTEAAAPQAAGRAEAVAPGVSCPTAARNPGLSAAVRWRPSPSPGEYLLRAAARQEEMQGLAFVRVTVNP